MAKPSSTTTRNGKPRLKTFGLKQLLQLKENSKRPRDKQKIQKEIDRRN